jgi:hypothetical protein
MIHQADQHLIENLELTPIKAIGHDGKQVRQTTQHLAGAARLCSHGPLQFGDKLGRSDRSHGLRLLSSKTSLFPMSNSTREFLIRPFGNLCN